MALVFLFLYAPILLLVVFSFNAGGSNVVWEGFSLRWYQELFQDRRMMEAVYTTLLVSVLATLISTVAGTFASVGLYGMKKRWREPILSVNNIPIMNADIVTGVALCIFFVAVIGGWNDFVTFLEENFRRTLPRLEMGFGTLLLAHLSFDIPYVILNVLPKLRQMDSSLIDAAQDLGSREMYPLRSRDLSEVVTAAGETWSSRASSRWVRTGVPGRRSPVTPSTHSSMGWPIS